MGRSSQWLQRKLGRIFGPALDGSHGGNGIAVRYKYWWDFVRTSFWFVPGWLVLTALLVLCCCVYTVRVRPGGGRVEARPPLVRRLEGGVLGPVWAGVIFESVGITSPFFVGAGLVAVAASLGRTTPTTPTLSAGGGAAAAFQPPALGPVTEPVGHGVEFAERQRQPVVLDRHVEKV